MKVITLWQPWASFIALGWKTIETRDHDRFKNLVGETIGIHAGNVWDKNWFKLTIPYLTREQRLLTITVHQEFKKGDNEFKGKILCTAKVDATRLLLPDDSKDALIYCPDDLYNRRFGLFLKDIKPIHHVAVKGKRGIWNYEFKEGELIYL